MSSAVAIDQKTRVLVIDDSALSRRMIVQILEQSPSVEVIGTAADGAAGLQQISRLRPDVVTLDLEMPVLDGLGVLRRLQKETWRPKIVVLSAYSERGAAVTMDALSLGATDYVLKPGAGRGGQSAMDVLKGELIPKLEALGRRVFRAGFTPRVAAPVAPRAKSDLKAVVIGVSTGGPGALGQLIPRIPGTLPVPILVVQHMPAMFTKRLAERLDETSALKVCEAQEGQRVVPGTVYIAPGDHHMTVARAGGAHIRLNQGPPEQSCRPAADVLFRSAAEVYGGHVMVLVLTGMGQDGLAGTEILRNLGAYVVAQNEETSVVWGMPGAVVQAGLAHAVLPLSEISTAVKDAF